MKICVISPGVVHAISRTQAIAEHFTEVHFVDLKGRLDSSDFASGNITIHKIPRWGESFYANFDLLKLLHEIKPDAIVCHYASGQHLFLAIMYGKSPVAVICMGHDILFDEGDCHVPFLKKYLTKLALKQAAYISAKSKFLAARVYGFGVDKKVDINYWGADLTTFQPQDQNLARDRLKLRKDSMIILSPRALEPRLNIDLIVKSFARVQENVANVELIILGRSSLTYKMHIEKLIKKLGLVETVHIIDEIEQNKLPDYYNASDLVVSMASSEGFPNTVLEVMACGVPILVGKIPQTSELLSHKENAYLCDISSLSIANNTIEILKSRQMNKITTEHALQLVKIHADIIKNGAIFSKKLKMAIKIYQPASMLFRIKFKLLNLTYLLVRKISRS